MKREDFVIGGQYRVNRQGLVNHGRVGTCKRVGVHHVDLEIHVTGDTHTFNMKSLAPVVAEPEPPKVEPKPRNEFKVAPEDRKPLKKSNEPVKPKIVEVEVLAKPEENSLVFFRDGDKIYHGWANDFDFGEDQLQQLWGDRVIQKEDYLGYLEEGKTVFIKKPDNIMEYPFWSMDWGDVVEIGTNGRMAIGVGNNQNKTYFFNARDKHQDRKLFKAEWIDFDRNFIRTAKAKREMFPEGYVPDFMEQALIEARNEAATASGLAFAIWVSIDNKLRHYSREGAACHYAMKTFLNGADRQKAKGVLAKQYITDTYYRYFEDGERELVNSYLLWVANDSPWSQYIETKDLDTARNEGFTVKMDIPANAMMCTFYALRYPTEYPKTIRRWQKGIELGAHPTVAFYYAETEGFARDRNSHHMLLDTHSMDMNDLIRFIKHEQGKTLAKVYSDRYWGYEYVSKHHGQKRYPDKTALDQLQEEFKGGVEEIKHPVLGVQKKKVPAIQQVINYLMQEREKA